MKYFIDTEFIEGFHKPLFGKRRHFIDLISIGIVCEDGREYYAISNEYKYNMAGDWVKENVIQPLYLETVSGGARNFSEPNNFHKIYGKSNKQIADELKGFCLAHVEVNKHRSLDKWGKDCPLEFYGYYSDYDWVVFCSLFGRMIDLPKGFPMYCKDLKQMLDAYVTNRWLPDSKKYMKGTGVDMTFDLALSKLKNLEYYPKQDNEHSALGDARWNKKLYDFLSFK